jgi:hypothetical protein
MKYLLLLGALTLGCVSTNASWLNPSLPKYEPVAAEDVRIVVDESELDSLEFVRIAVIEATAPSEYTDQTAMIEAIRKKAGKLGGNAVLLPKIYEPDALSKVVAREIGTITERKGTAIALRILGEKQTKLPD